MSILIPILMLWIIIIFFIRLLGIEFGIELGLELGLILMATHENEIRVRIEFHQFQLTVDDDQIKARIESTHRN